MIHVLYVDEEPENLKNIRYLLEKTGDFRVDILATATGGLEKISTARYDVLISEYAPSEMTGIQFMHEVRAVHADLPFIFITKNEKDLREAINSGADAIIPRDNAQDPDSRILINMIREIILNRTASDKSGIRETLIRENTESALRNSEKLCLSTIESIDEAIHVVNSDLEIELINRSAREWCRNLGIERTDFRGMKLYDLFGFLPAKVQDEYEQVFSTGESLTTREESIIDGIVIISETHKIPVTEDGNISRVITRIHDITEEVRHKEQESAEYDLARDLASVSSPEKALEICLENVMQISGADFGAVETVDPHTGNLNLIYTKGVSERFRKALELYKPDPEETSELLSGDVIYSQLPEHRFTPLKEAAMEEGLRANAIIPVLHKGAITARLNIASHNIRSIPESDRNILAKIATQMKGVIARLKAEESLKETDEQIQLALTGASMGTWNWDIKSGRIVINGKGSEILALWPVELEEDIKMWENRVHPLDLPGIKKAIRDHIELKIPYYESSYRVRCNDGTCKWILGRGKVVQRDREGDPLRMAGIFQEITRAREAEIERQYHNAVLDTVNSAAETLIVSPSLSEALYQIIKDAGTVTEVNKVYICQNDQERSVCRRVNEWINPMNKDPESLDISTPETIYRDRLGMLSSGRIIHSNADDFPEEEMEYLLSTGIHSLLIVPLFTGDELWGCIGFESEKKKEWTDGEIKVISTLSDIIGSAIMRREAENTLLESEKRLEIAIESADIGIWEWDTARKKVSQSGPLLENLENPDDRTDSNEWKNYVHPDDIDVVRELLDEHIKGNSQRFESEERLRGRNHTWRWIRSLGKISARDKQGQPLRMAGIHIDITEARHQIDAIEEANRKLNLLSGITRHDILNQITMIRGYIEIIKDTPPDDPALPGYLAKIDHMTNTIQNQISFTGDYETLGASSPEWQNVRDTVDKVSGSALSEEIHLEVTTGQIEIFADPMLERAVFTILENAVRHGGSVTEIMISFHEEGKDGILVIEDNGVGVPEVMKKRIFERGIGDNTGFGLYLITEILSITDISVSETGKEGKGARFEIRVPVGLWRAAPGML